MDTPKHTHHTVPDVPPDFRPSTTDRHWGAAFVTLPETVRSVPPDPAKNRIYIAGYGALSLDRARQLAAVLLSAIARADERWCNVCQAHTVCSCTP